ncbi:MAG TPA: phosphatidylglycerophosphatase, partial [Candidatus Thermoplasmatota archaeon]|nr:phosphatidylglycerophosphatase [Candidatus Thermoplasmatota archaeon]
VAGVFALLIPIASFYLGVHWIVDALVGEAFAVLAVAVGVKLLHRADSPASSTRIATPDVGPDW